MRAYFDGILFEPCVVRELQWIDAAPAYNVYFDTDQTQVDGVTEDEIAGPSSRTPRHDDGWEQPEYRRGDIVKALYDGVEYDPCLIEQVTVVRGVPRYTIYFDADSTFVAKMTLGDITGRSSNELANYPNADDESPMPSATPWKHGDIVRARYRSKVLDPVRVIRITGRNAVVHWGLDGMFSEIGLDDIVGASSKEWTLAKEDENLRLA